jgi:hypothetical protein
MTPLIPMSAEVGMSRSAEVERTDAGTADPRETAECQYLEQRLVSRFSPPLAAEEVERCLLECIANYEDAPVRTYIAVMIERAATDHLRSAVHDITVPHSPRSISLANVPDVTAPRVRADRRTPLGGVGWSPP